MTRHDPGVSGDKSKTPEMVAKFYNLVTDFYECVSWVLPAASVALFVLCSAVVLLYLFSFDSGTGGASVFILLLRRKEKGMLQDCPVAARHSLHLNAAAAAAAAPPPPPPPPPSPVSSHSSGIRRHDERIADAIEMNGSTSVTCDE